MVDMIIPAIVLFGAMILCFSQMPKVFKDLWVDIKELYNIK